MPAHNEVAFRRHSAAPLVVRALVKPPLERRQVDFEDKYGVEQVDELREEIDPPAGPKRTWTVTLQSAV